MKKEMTVFKVVSRREPAARFISAVVRETGFEREYGVGEWTHAPTVVGIKAPLMAFKSLDKAREFRSEYVWRGKIFEAEAVNARPAPQKYKITGENLLRLWMARKKRKSLKAWFNYVPKGTILCDSIKLIREII